MKGLFMIEKTLENLNNQGFIAYQLKCMVALIHHFGYDIEKWREILEYITDYTWLHCTYEKERGLRANSERDWFSYSGKYTPSSILMPVGIPQHSTNKLLFPCRVCGNCKYQFADYGADYGLCMNIPDCQYVKENYRFHGGGRYGLGDGVYRKSYELFLRTDFNLLRVLNNIMDNDTEMSDFFEEGRIVFVWDTLKVLDSLNVPHPDFDDIHEFAFGKENQCKRFSTLDLIQ